jgi:acetylornithine deacetylase/succinyl-diaminopimelate desuccinylase-like protein
MLRKALTYAHENRETFISQLQDWLRIPSISTLPEHRDDLIHAAEFAASKLRDMGFADVDLDTSRSHPILYTERTGLSAPTLLVYGHFDVQPVDPLDAWTRPPFDPVMEGDNLYARGASDDKGQAFAILTAFESYLKSSGELPVNVKVLLEGEEEIASACLKEYIRENAEKLSADAILIADSDMLDAKLPTIMYGVRGSLSAEIEVTGPGRDLHSGTFGGAVDNPLNVLVRLLAKIQDGEMRKVLIPGFYDKVETLSQEERDLLAQVPITDEVGLHFTGAPALGGEEGYPLRERISVRPTFEVHGIVGGFTGEGKKSVIPASAKAKISTRLVPNQDPDEVADLLKTYLEKISPPTVKVELHITGKGRPVKVDYNSKPVQLAAQAYKNGFGYDSIFLRGGGSLPIVREMIDMLSQPGKGDIPVVMIGFGLPDDRTHAPNEKFHLPNFYNGIDTVIHYLELFKNISP